MPLNRGAFFHQKLTVYIQNREDFENPGNQLILYTEWKGAETEKMVALSLLKDLRLQLCRKKNRYRKAEKALRNAAGKMKDRYRQRIDCLRKASGMKREHFDAVVMDLIARQKVDLVQGEFAERIALSDEEFKDLIEIDGITYLYLIWPDRISETHIRISSHPPDRWKNQNIPLSSDMAQWLHAMKRTERIVRKLGSDD